MVITRATEYAIRAVLFMAMQPSGTTVLKKDICREQGITPAFLTKILQPLIKCGIFGSHRGVRGGFYLNKQAASITMLDVIKAEEGAIHLNLCLEEAGICQRETHCPVHKVWQEARAGLVETLSSYTFAQLAEMADQGHTLHLP
ncbi:MAG: Rrf2 family transcriptional regulator [Desulfuromonas sp.]|nr:MAG: Rrf2 family transcriptional regulator [Desulfuromonas sp.]